LQSNVRLGRRPRHDDDDDDDANDDDNVFVMMEKKKYMTWILSETKSKSDFSYWKRQRDLYHKDKRQL
jgi:hypothetical protein